MGGGRGTPGAPTVIKVMCMRARVSHLALVALLAGLLAIGPAAAAAAQELPDLPPDLSDLPLELPGIDELPAIPGLDLLDPALGPVADLVDELSGLVGDLVGAIPLLNTLLLGGEDAVDAAIAFSRATFETSPTALLARADLFPDALTTGALQGLFDAPLLLSGGDELDERVVTELERLETTNVVVLGNEQAISETLTDALAADGLNVYRLGGATRIETAVAAVSEANPDATTAVLTRAYAAEGADDAQAFADLLGVSPWAAEHDWPVLLSQSEVLTPSVAAFLADSALTEIIIIGGETAISAAVEEAINELGIATRRVAGSNRFATAIAIAEERGYATSGDPGRVILAEGTGRDDIWAPGFAAAAHGYRHGAPVILSDGLVIPPETMAYLTDGLADNLLDGGPALLCASFVSPIACEAAGLLLLGHLTAALDLLGLELGDLPNLGQLLTTLGLAGLLPPEVQDLVVQIDAILALMDGVVPEDLADLPGGIEGLLELIPGGAEGLADLVPPEILPDLGELIPGLGDLLPGLGGDGVIPGLLDVPELPFLEDHRQP